MASPSHCWVLLGWISESSSRQKHASQCGLLCNLISPKVWCWGKVSSCSSVRMDQIKSSQIQCEAFSDMKNKCVQIEWLLFLIYFLILFIYLFFIFYIFLFFTGNYTCAGCISYTLSLFELFGQLLENLVVTAK